MRAAIYSVFTHSNNTHRRPHRNTVQVYSPFYFRKCYILFFLIHKGWIISKTIYPFSFIICSFYKLFNFYSAYNDTTLGLRRTRIGFISFSYLLSKCKILGSRDNHCPDKSCRRCYNFIKYWVNLKSSPLIIYRNMIFFF